MRRPRPSIGPVSEEFGPGGASRASTTWSASRSDKTSAEWVADPVPTLDERLPEIGVPTLLLWASDAEISPLPLGQRLSELIPNGELVTYQSTDHWVVLENVEDVAARLEHLVGLR